MYPMQEKSKETNKAPDQIALKDGLYAVEIPDEIPPLKHVKFLDEQANFRDARPYTKEDLAYYWRSKERTVGLILTLSSFGILVILLSATTKYTNGIWEILMFVVNFILSFIIGLIPESALSWIPI